MAKLIVWNIMSLDGAFEGATPWDLSMHETVWGPELETLSKEQLADGTILLFGRRTYEGMADYWQKAADEPGEISAGMNNAPFCVGFAAESEDLARRAVEKRARKNIPLLAANLAQDALGGDENAIRLYDDRGEHDLGRGSKLELARKLVAHVAGMLAARK